MGKTSIVAGRGSMEEMQKTNVTITFTCPGCKETFEFDDVGESEFVPCPICGTSSITVKKGKTLLLKAFTFSPNTPPIQSPVASY